MIKSALWDSQYDMITMGGKLDAASCLNGVMKC